MKRFTLAAGACALALASVLPSFAADMPRGRYAEPAPSYFSWSGFYLGLNAGYGWGTSDWSSGVTAGSTEPAGGLFGGTVGVQSAELGLGLRR
jgi:outer membrane immunogenic protein